jgi:hypothetical protein
MVWTVPKGSEDHILYSILLTQKYAQGRRARADFYHIFSSAP